MASFIGGEFWYDPRFRTDTVNVPAEEMTFLNGGEAALRLICADLLSRGVREALVPSYMCPTVMDAFDRYGLDYRFYRVRPDFRIDLDDLLKQAPGFKVLYAINYFGCGFSDDETAAFDRFKAQGMTVVEDDAQAGFNRASVADVHFNSLRKIVPYDGSFFYSDHDVSASLAKFAGLPNRRLPVIREFRRTFARLLAEGAESFDVLNPFFDESERQYYADLTVFGDPDERAAAERLDWKAIEAIRKANHRHLCERLADTPGIEVLFPQVSPHGPPLGLPIHVKDGRRDALLKHLRARHVYPPVHWDIVNDPRIKDHPEAIAMSAGMVTLVLDQRFDEEDMEYEAGVVRSFFGCA